MAYSKKRVLYYLLSTDFGISDWAFKILSQREEFRGDQVGKLELELTAGVHISQLIHVTDVLVFR
jgi:hypothetical protein